MRTGWSIAKVGQVCSLMTGGTPNRSKPEYFGGEIKWLVSGDIHQGEIFDCEGRITDLGFKSSNARILPTNSVMIALNGQGKTRGTVALLRVPATCNQSLVSITPNNPEQLMPEFLYANLHGRYQEIRRMTGDDGNDRRGLNMPLIRGIEIPLPPLEQQQRIVTILDAAFAGIATARAAVEKNRQNARALFESHLQSIFTLRGDGWSERPLSEVATIVNGYAFKSGDFSPSGLIKSIKITNVGVREFVETTDSGLPENFTAQFSSVAVPAGSLVIALTRTIIADGLKVAVVPASYDRALVNQRVAALLPKPELASATYLFAYLSTPIVLNYVKERVNTLMQPNLSINDLRAMPIPLPPADECKGIIDRLETIEEETQRLESLYQQKLTALDALKQSLLHQAFSGQL